MKETVYVLAFCVLVIQARNLPSYITKCSREVSSFPECFLKNVEAIRPHLPKGIPEMGIPALEPLIIPTAKTPEASFEDVHISNGCSFQVLKIHINENNNTGEAKVYVPYLDINSKYEINGKILLLQLKGNGTFHANITDIIANLIYSTKPYLKKSREFYKLQLVKRDLQYKVKDVYFGNLFQEREELTMSTNKFINENIDEILIEFKPILDEVATNIFNGLVGRVFERYSINELFS